jgi:uncharacterized protein YgbK (DUF1537 family)
MIAVIADDFTGAAELAGISLRYGLTVELCLLEVNYTNADVLIVCTDSRSVKEEAAKKITADIVTDVVKLQPLFIYKKIDSVLRGHVLAELETQMEICVANKACILSANPSLGRTINNGNYFIDGIKIENTAFANDPEFPIKSSLVKNMLGNTAIGVLQLKDDLPLHSIVVLEAVSTDEVNMWANRLDDNWMLVGAGDFYDAILNMKFTKKEMSVMPIQLPHLYVCGTAFENSRQHLNKADCVAYLSDAMMLAENANDECWINATCQLIQDKQQAIVAIDKPLADALSLRTTMAKAVKAILHKTNVVEIFIEGGSTAASILQALGIQKMNAVSELQRGVVKLSVQGLLITVKPGSYALPKQIEELYFNE